ncbi:hypothetical protein E2C01_101219 [Portunus trituberculatus]|uniref:Uncharacterized protein n=1 Tax=Portunus trituberculatus TaxID=210409 RepID=A0A5B7KA33_PORTR|nr:hypothetical protein [Portunus trituberculatus]
MVGCVGVGPGGPRAVASISAHDTTAAAGKTCLLRRPAGTSRSKMPWSSDVQHDTPAPRLIMPTSPQLIRGLPDLTPLHHNMSQALQLCL